MRATLKVNITVPSDKITVSVLESSEYVLMHFILLNLTVMTWAICRKVREYVTVSVVDVSPNSFRDEISNMVKISIFYKNNMCGSMTLQWNKYIFSYKLVTESPSPELTVYEFMNFYTIHRKKIFHKTFYSVVYKIILAHLKQHSPIT